MMARIYFRSDSSAYADDGRALQSALQELTYQTTVPNIFINRKHIGGNSELQDIKEEFPELLRGAGAL